MISADMLPSLFCFLRIANLSVLGIFIYENPMLQRFRAVEEERQLLLKPQLKTLLFNKEFFPFFFFKEKERFLLFKDSSYNINLIKIHNLLINLTPKSVLHTFRPRTTFYTPYILKVYLIHTTFCPISQACLTNKVSA